jgi:hypothetical protein
MTVDQVLEEMEENTVSGPWNIPGINPPIEQAVSPREIKRII